MMPDKKACRLRGGWGFAVVFCGLALILAVGQAWAEPDDAKVVKQQIDMRFQAVPVVSENECAIQLTWRDAAELEAELGIDLPLPLPVAVYRSTVAYPQPDGSDGGLIFFANTDTMEYLDADVLPGTTYYYTLVVGYVGTIYYASSQAEAACFSGSLQLRAVATKNYDKVCVVGLTWNPLPIPLTLYRSTDDYPLLEGAIDGELLVSGESIGSFLDEDVYPGETYFYTLLAGEVLSPIAVAYAKATACDDGLLVLTERFGPGAEGVENPFDLAHSQVTFRPVMAPPPSLDDNLAGMDFSDYEVTVVHDVYELPVPRSDDSGDGYVLSLMNDGAVPIDLGQMAGGGSIYYFGTRYRALSISANGYIAFLELPVGLPFDPLQALFQHFDWPRIAFFNTDLMPDLSGEVWIKPLDDSLVVTFEGVAVRPDTLVLNPERVTIQVELFFSGHIRITYLGAAMAKGLVGLSDGRGVPVEPVSIYEDLWEAYRWAEFSAFPATPGRMSIYPIAPPMVNAGTPISFTAEAEMPLGMTAKPHFYAVWDGPGDVPFTDGGNGTGRFEWTPGLDEDGEYMVRVVAETGNRRVFQDVMISVLPYDIEDFLPTAVNLQISSNTDLEDPTMSRAVLPGKPLIASYEYSHPFSLQRPSVYGEGRSLIYWFRNNQIVTALTNMLVVPLTVPKPGDTWWFQVTPISKAGLWGDPVKSPVISIVSVPVISNVTPDKGLTVGGDRVTIRGQYLSYALKVKFGNVPGDDIVFVSDNEIVVSTPVHAAGKVSVSVETVAGVASKMDAFTYISDGPEPEEEKPRRLLGCGIGGDGASGSLFFDCLPALALLLATPLFRKRDAGEAA